MNRKDIPLATELNSRIEWLKEQLLLNEKIQDAYKTENDYPVQWVTYQANDLALPHEAFIGMLKLDHDHKTKELILREKLLAQL